jgi:hypothetical protein
MKNIHIRRLYYRIRHQYLTQNNAVLAVGVFVAISWAWGSVQAMERNYALQKEVDYKRRELQLARLQTETLRFEQNYYESDEYKELAIRERLGLVNPGEKVLILPPNTETSDDSVGKSTQPIPQRVSQSNFQQWANFLFGGRSGKLQD